MSKIEGYIFNHPKYLRLALLHPSLKKAGKPESYERLEFLGDSVLGLIIADIVYHKFQDLPEGKLALIHSSLVKTDTLAKIALKLGLNEKLKMDISEENNNGRANKNNLENAIEALVGAIYLDGGFEAAYNFVRLHWAEVITADLAHLKKDAKSMLQEWAQKNNKPIPEYIVINQSGKDHSPLFNIEVRVQGLGGECGTGKSKKHAQLEAATKLLEKIKNIGLT